MIPIVEFFDYIFSTHFNEFLHYDQIKQHDLPLWLFALVGVLVLAILLWIFLITQGLKHLINRLLFQDSTCSSFNDGTNGNKLNWPHISARKPTYDADTFDMPDKNIL